jgi:hypothetical protein
MDTYRFKCRVGDDGILNLKVPVNVENGEVEVLVVVQPLESKPFPQKPGQEPPRAYEPWTEDEERQLMELYHAETDTRIIAEKLGRRPRAIEARVLKILARGSNDKR